MELKGIVESRNGNVNKIQLIMSDPQNFYYAIPYTGELTEEALKQAFPGIVIPERLRGKLK